MRPVARLVPFVFCAFVSFSAFGGFASTETFLPAVGRIAGQGGAQFYTTVWVTNLTGVPVDFRFDFLKQGQANPAPASFTDTLAPGQTKIYENVVETKLGLTSAIGAARITSSGEILVAERIFNQPPGADLGSTVGLFFAGVPRSFSISSGQSASIQGINQGSTENFRYNFALVETGGGSPTVNVQVFDGGGVPLGQKVYPLHPYEQLQPNVAEIVPGIATTNARITATVTGGGGSALLAGAQLANVSQDSSGFEMSFRDEILGSGGSTGVTSLNGLAGALTLKPGNGISITPSGSNVTIAYTGGGSTGLTTVTHDATLTGAGTGASPLGVVGGSGGGLALPFSGSADAPSGAVFSISNTSTGIGIDAHAINQSAIHGASVNSRGVFGEGGAYGVVGTGGTLGVWGTGATGVYGVGSNQVDSIGVLGHGIKGVFGQGDGAGSYGLYGTGQYGVYATGVGYGIRATGGTFGVYGEGPASGGYGVFCEGNFAVTGTKNFVEPHPTDAGKEIRFVSLEGPESGTYFRGSSRTVNGSATIDVPESFRMVTDDENLTVVATPRGELALVACVKASLDRIEIRSSKDVDFDFIVNGVRKAFKNHEAISENRAFVPRSAADPDFGRGLPAESIRRLKATGILNADGTVNIETAHRLGWDQRPEWTQAVASAAADTPR